MLIMQGTPLPHLPFDEKTATIPNTAGRVRDMPGVYCAGWIKRGATGVIATTMTDSFQTAAAILDDIKTGKIPAVEHQGGDAVRALIRSKVLVDDFVSLTR